MNRAISLAVGLVFLGDALATDAPHNHALIFHEDPDVVQEQILQAVNKAHFNPSATGIVMMDFVEVPEGYCGLFRPIVEGEDGDASLGPVRAVSLASEDGGWDQHVLKLGENAIWPHGFCPPVGALTSELEQRLLSALGEQGLVRELGGAEHLVQFDAYRLREVIYAQSSDQGVYDYQIAGVCGQVWGYYHSQYDPAHARWRSLEVMPPHSVDLDPACLASHVQD